jgi:3',5'-cyclic-AMP phosphodiesterase
MSDRLYFVQISDLHLRDRGGSGYAGRSPGEYVGACIRAIEAMNPRPDFVLVTGDITDTGRREEYLYAEELLSPLSMPYYVIPGNHDSRSAMIDVFPDSVCPVDENGFIQYSFQYKNYDFIGLDTLDEGHNDGWLCPKRLAWLEEVLSRNPESSRIVFLHHPPVRTGIGFMDDIRLRNSNDFASILGSVGGETHILCGHIHRAISTLWKGCSLHICPGLMHHISFSIAPDHPPVYRFEPPAFRVILDTPDSLLVHTTYVEDYGPDFPF